MPLTEEQKHRLETENPMILVQDSIFMAELEEAIFLENPQAVDVEHRERQWEKLEKMLSNE